MIKNKTKNQQIVAGGGNIEKNGGGGPQEQQNAKLKKIGDPFNYLAPFLEIWEENGSQDGGQNQSNINKNRFKS